MVQLANLNKNRHQEATFSTWRLSLFSMVQLANLNKKQRLARLDPRFTSKLFFSLFYMMQLAGLNKNRHREAAFSPRVVWIRVLPLNCFSLFSMQQLAEREGGGSFFKWGVALVKPRHLPFSHAVYFWGVGGILGKKCDTCDTIKKDAEAWKVEAFSILICFSLPI